MTINFFKHPDLARINEELKPLAQSLHTGNTIQAIHTPIVLPLNTSDEIGGYARSLDFLFKKYIAIDCNRFLRETPTMQKFILERQIALFDKFSRCLHLPIAAAAVATAFIASTILFPSSMLAAVTIPAIVGLVSAVIVSKKERENEKYADLKAFRKFDNDAKQDILKQFDDRIVKQAMSSYKRTIFSGYPSYVARHYALLRDPQTPESIREPYLPNYGSLLKPIGSE